MRMRECRTRNKMREPEEENKCRLREQTQEKNEIHAPSSMFLLVNFKGSGG
jgi:hypothetical protein